MRWVITFWGHFWGAFTGTFSWVYNTKNAFSFFTCFYKKYIKVYSRVSQKFFKLAPTDGFCQTPDDSESDETVTWWTWLKFSGQYLPDSPFLLKEYLWNQCQQNFKNSLLAFCPVSWDCRIHRLLLCGGVRHPQRVSWWWGSSNAGALGNAEYPFIAIALRSTLPRSGSTW